MYKKGGGKRSENYGIVAAVTAVLFRYGNIGNIIHL